MKYTDKTLSNGEKYINGHYVGVKHGTPTPDALDSSHTGYEVHAESIRQGTITQDALETVNKLVLISIFITTPATKTQYSVGDDLDLAGLVVTGTYDGNVKNIVDITTNNVDGFDSSKAVAKQTLTITVDGKTATYDIKIV